MYNMQIALGLIRDLKSVYPEIIAHKPLSETSDSSFEQVLMCMNRNKLALKLFFFK